MGLVAARGVKGELTLNARPGVGRGGFGSGAKMNAGDGRDRGKESLVSFRGGIGRGRGRGIGAVTNPN